MFGFEPVPSRPSLKMICLHSSYSFLLITHNHGAKEMSTRPMLLDAILKELVGGERFELPTLSV
jgi:hypothetical protein